MYTDSRRWRRGARCGSWLVAFAVLSSCGGATPRVERPAASTQMEWERWSGESFARARAEDRIIVADVGTTWCPWCRIMERRTYGDAQVREILDEHFVAIREDADARPDLGLRFRRWGWPATVFLTPEGETIEVLRGFRDPARFAAILESLVTRQREGRLGRSEPLELAATTDSLVAVRDRVQQQLDGYFDAESGGWGRSVRYPVAAPVEQAFLRAAVRGEHEWRDRALLTLRGTANLIDPVWGGMGQAAFGRRWDRNRVAWDIIGWQNAQTLGTFARASALTGDPQYLEAATSIAGFAEHFLSSPEGAFYASAAGYTVGESGETVRMGQSRYMTLDDAGRRAMGLPPVDDSVYPHVNGLYALALIELHEATGDERWLSMATRALRTVVATHGREGGGFRHVAGAEAPAMLADQFAMGRALLALWQRTGDAETLTLARQTADYLIETFRDSATGALRSSTTEGGTPRANATIDDAGNAAQFLMQLHHATSEDQYRQIAHAGLLAVAQPERSRRQHRLVGAYLVGIEAVLLPVVHFSVVGSLDDPAARSLHRAALSFHDPRRFLEVSEPGTRYPDTGAAALYLCDDSACSAPVTDPAQVADRATEFLAAASSD